MRIRSKSNLAAYRRCMDPQAELARQLRSIDERRVNAFLDVIARLAVEDVQRERAKYTVKIRSCA